MSIASDSTEPREVAAVHGRRRTLADTGFEVALAEGLGSLYEGTEFAELYARFAIGDDRLNIMMRKAIFNAELSTPFPGAGNDRTLRLYGFFDAGNVFTERGASLTDAQWKAQNRIRASAGIGISWISPLGPLRLAYAVPIRYQKLDETNNIAADRMQRVQFQIGTAF